MITFLFRLIGRFFALIWRTLDLVRRLLVNLVLVLVLLVLGVLIFWRPVTSLPDHSALILRPVGDLVEGRTLRDPLSLLRPGPSPVAETQLSELVAAVEAARSDERITALVLETDELAGGGLSKLAELRQAIESFKLSGKPVYARGERFTQGQYYLASVADELHLAPDGLVLLTGFARYITFYKNALDRLGINVRIFRVGDYKSFTEPFTREDMSDEDRASTRDLLEGLWSIYRNEISASRGIPPAAFDQLVNDLPEMLRASGGDAAEMARAGGLVDRFSTRAEWRERMREQVGVGEDGKGYRGVGVAAYLAHHRSEQDKVADQIAVVVAQGAIVDGQGAPGSIGGDSLSALIREVREDERVKALVLRIDSPGGSAWASELIRRELELTRQAGKPVVASMSSVAASGGYWIAVGADEIWAHPATVTGSIGVFAMFPELAEPMEKLGLTLDGVATGPFAGALDPRRPMDPGVADALQQSVEHTYGRFITLVSDARRMPAHEVELIAGGRVWTGEAAKKLGLVDGLGGLDAAVAAAAARTGLQRYDLVWPATDLSPKDMVLERLGDLIGSNPPAQLRQGAAGVLLDQFDQAVAEFMIWNDPRYLYARCQCAAP